MSNTDEHSQPAPHTFSDTQSNLLKAISDNHAAQMQAQKAAIESSQRQAEECLRLRQAEELRISEERLRRASYDKLSMELNSFGLQVDLLLEIMRIMSSRMLKIHPPETPDEIRTVERMRNKDDLEDLKYYKLHELEKALINETDEASKIKLRALIAEMKSSLR